MVLLALLLTLQLADAEEVRLVSGASRCDGELQVKHSGRWREVRVTDFSLQAADVVCAGGDCGSAVSHEQREVPSRSVVTVSCARSNAPRRKCVVTGDGRDTHLHALTCSETVRLLNGSRLCSGRLEVYQDQSWASVCAGDLDLKDAEVVCRELGCGAPNNIQGVLYEEGKASVEQTFLCQGRETALTDCPTSSSGSSCVSGKAVVLVCREPVRLVGGSGGCAGTVELRHRGEWRPLSVQPDGPPAVAAAVCNLLDCGSPVSAERTFGFQDRPVWAVNTDCVSSRSAVRDCVLAANFSDTSALEVECSDADDVRLVGGASRCDGELQVKHSDRWREVRVTDFFLETAAVVCQRLGCGSAVSNERRVASPRSVLKISSYCVQSSTPLRKCVVAEDVWDTYLYALTCSEWVRLVHGHMMCSGLLEVYWDMAWTSVCVGLFDLQDAAVVCRELGCGAPRVLQVALYVEGRAPRAPLFHCEGHESSLRDCPRVSSGTDCASGKALVLTCSEPVRLVGGSGGCAGTVELRHRGQWRPPFVHPDGPPAVAAAVCPLLDCGPPASAVRTEGEPSRPMWGVNTKCVYTRSSVRDCVFEADFSHTTGVDVECSEKVNHLHWLWLIPALVTFSSAVLSWIFCKNRKSSSAQTCPANSGIVVCEEATYQSLRLDTLHQEVYTELRPQPRPSKSK